MSETQEIKDLLNDMKTAFDANRQKQTTLEAEFKAFGTRDVLLSEAATRAANDFAVKFEEYKNRLDSIDTRLNRTNIDTTDEKESHDLRDEIVMIKKMHAAKNGNLRPDSVITGTKEEGVAYRKAMQKFIRSGERAISDEETKAMSVGSDPDGGFWVRPVWANYIQERIYETSPMRQVCNIENIGTAEFKIPVDIDQGDAGWVSEQGARNITNTPVLKEKSIIAHEIYAQPKVTQTLLEDAIIDPEAWLMKKTSEKIGRVENTAFLRGNGVGKPRGILSYAAGSAGTTGAVSLSTGLNNWGEIEQIKTGANGLFTTDAMIAAFASMKEDYHVGASWLMHRTATAQLMSLKDSYGRYMFEFVLGQGFKDGQAMVLGYPLRFAADLDPQGTTAGFGAVFGNFKRAYTIVDRLGISILRDPYMYKPFVAFYVRKRVGGDVVDYDAVKIIVMNT